MMRKLQSKTDDKTEPFENEIEGISKFIDKLQNFFPPLPIFKVPDVGPKMKAFFALREHLEAAVNDPLIQAYPEMHCYVKTVYDQLGEMKVTAIKKPENIGSAFARPARAARAKTMTKNSTKVSATESEKIKSEVATAKSKNPKLSNSAAYKSVATKFKISSATVRRHCIK